MPVRKPEVSSSWDSKACDGAWTYRQHLGPATADRARRGCPAGSGLPRPVRARPGGRLPPAGGGHRPGVRQPAGHDARLPEPDGRPDWPPAPDVAYPRIIGANGPKMLALAGEIADGALPAGLPPEFTAQARQVLGPDKLLVVGVSVVVDADRDRARSTARERVSASLSRPSYAATIARLGYPDQDIAEVSDPLVDAIVGHGDPAAIATTVREHPAAGADHVTLMLPAAGEFTVGVDQLEQLAPALVAAG
nr:LLM class flavin-dependent oxidoreductase [Actinacidiphila oryziradicis]